MGKEVTGDCLGLSALNGAGMKQVVKGLGDPPSKQGGWFKKSVSEKCF